MKNEAITVYAVQDIGTGLYWRNPEEVLDDGGWVSGAPTGEADIWPHFFVEKDAAYLKTEDAARSAKGRVRVVEFGIKEVGPCR